MSEFKQANVVLLASVNGRDHWHPVKPEAVPAWVKEPDAMGRIVAGEAAMKCDEEGDGSMWYRAALPDELPHLARLLKAEERRRRRAVKRVLH